MLLATPLRATKAKQRASGQRDEKQPPLTHEACLQFSVPLVNYEAGARRGAPTLLSYTRMIGTDTLELLVPSLPFAYRYLVDGDFTLRFTLTLPAETVEIVAAPVYDKPLGTGETDMGYIVTGERVEIEAMPPQYERYDRGETEMACLLGVRIKEMSGRDRTLYKNCIEEMLAEEPTLVGQVTILPDDEEAELAFAATTPHAHYRPTESPSSFKIYGN